MTRPDPPPVQLVGKIVKETEKAVQIKFTDHPKFANRALWFPLSQTKSLHREFATKGNDRIVVSKWIYEQKLKEVVDETGNPDNGFDGDRDESEESFDSFGTNPND